MKRKIVWFLLSCLMVVALALASCGPAAVEEEEEVVPPTEEEEVAPKVEEEEEEVVLPEAKGPVYGGWLTTASETSSIGGWDPVYGEIYWALHPVSLPLMRGDFYAGPAGTNEVSWRYPVQGEPEIMTRGLAESWELPDAKTMVFHLRKGINWHDKPPVNGREVTSEDIKWSYDRMLEIPRSGIPQIADYIVGGITYSAPDKYTFIVEFGKPDVRSLMTNDWYRFVAHEVIEQYGSQDDWRHVVGNGPFIVTDYVGGSSITYEKNPNYWETDPEGRNVPFIDGYTILIISDASTRLAALRAGKIDMLHLVPWRDAEDMLETNPELETTGGFPYTQRIVGMSCDTPPFDDVRVRRALAMAIDQEAIARDYHKGRAGIFPSVMLPPGSPMFVPLEERPASTQELFKYNPEKAKELLAEAGYPNGFKTQIEITSASDYADLSALVKDYWSKIGVDAEIKVYEQATYTSLLYGLKLKAVRIGGSILSWGNWSWVYQPGSRWCFEKFEDDQLLEMITEACTEYVDRTKWIEDWRNINIYVVDQAYEHCIPSRYVYNLWQPWVKNFHGEYSLGRTDYRGFSPYIWLDLDMKEEMIGKR